MYVTPTLTTEEVNSLISEHFIKIFGNVVEHYPAAAIRVLKNRPFKNATDIYQAFQKYLEGLNVNEKEKILVGHPDLVAKLADLSRFFLEYPQNQRVIGAERLSIEDKQTLGHLNRRYKEKFGFPFVICGKENNISTILSEMEKRMANTKQEEITEAMKEVMKISELRILEIVWK